MSESVRVLVCEGPWSMTRQNFYSFSFKVRLRLDRFLPMLRYGLYIPLDKNLHFASSITLLQEIIRNFKYDI